MDTLDATLPAPTGAQSVDRAFQVLRLIAAMPEGASIKSVVAQSGLSRPTVYRLIATLLRNGFAVQDPGRKTYTIGPAALTLARTSTNGFSPLDAALGSLMHLSDLSGDTSFFSIREGAFCACLHREEGSFPVRTQALHVGERHPLGVGAGAMAILAALDQDQVDTVMALNRDLLARRYKTFTPAYFDTEIAAARHRGWSLNPGLHFANSWGIGVAVKDREGAVIGALSIAAIDSRLSDARQAELARALQIEADTVTKRLDIIRP
ncbi:IclR family transcriptional regulator [Rhodophyticola sp. CCM32]|uniref:IclR family transcriptional regulator n=1 Tax=Rhodophyticola sp. CCM32 TaxID=2916397 RepID=UPI00107F31B6|nr:IclR family transcriptional regulator [Rhodophyticola sp. CCM32]QBX99925.1 IclR family transcriptional regulator [Rhodophyticola sp. CCM32]